MILMIDNYDSFTYNLIQYMEQLGASVHVVRNDEITLKDIDMLNPAGIMISPGPGRPESAIWHDAPSALPGWAVAVLVVLGLAMLGLIAALALT